MKKLRIGVVGLGDISRVYLNNLKKYSDLVLRAAWKRHRKKPRNSASRTPTPVQKI